MRNRPARVTILAAAALGVAGGLTLAHAAEPPDNVVAAVAAAGQQCKDLGGEPNTDAVLTVDDVNGDGGEDWIVDYAKLDCAGGVNPMCGSAGCTLEIYLWDGAMAWGLAFEETVEKYKFARSGAKRLLKVAMAGDACDRPSSQVCNFTYRLEKDAIVPLN